MQVRIRRVRLNVTVRKFEEQVWKVEGIRLVVCSASDVEVRPYDYQKAAAGHWTVRKWLDERVHPRTGSREIVVIDGYGERINRKTVLRTMRDSYHDAEDE